MGKNRTNPESAKLDLWNTFGMPFHLDEPEFPELSGEVLPWRLVRPDQLDDTASAFTIARKKGGI